MFESINTYTKGMKISEQEIETRAHRAQELFHEGFNCSQSVFAACADLYGVTDEAFALRLAASFGGGIGRMRQTCGAACGMFLLGGLENGSATPGDHEGKTNNYALVQELAAKFKEEHGNIICSELLSIAPHAQQPTPEPRTDTYYKKRPCAEIVGNAVRIYLQRVSK